MNLQSLYALTAALLGGVAVYFAIQPLTRIGRGAGKALSDFVGSTDDLDRGGPQEAVAVGSEKHRIRLAFQDFGLDVSGREETAQWAARIVAIVLIAAAVILSGLPQLSALAALPIGWLMVKGTIDGAWRKRRQAVERELPVFLSRLAGVTQATPNVIDALDDVGNTLDPDGPLKAWVGRFTSRLQTNGQLGLQEGLEEAYAISPSLGVTAFEIGRLWETGGSGYASAFSSAADNLSGVLEARAIAISKGEGARGSIRVILLALLGAILLMTTNPYTRDILQKPVIQIGYLIGLAWVALGWTFVNGTIDEAVS